MYPSIIKARNRNIVEINVIPDSQKKYIKARMKIGKTFKLVMRHFSQ